jgi:hypothetical protein
VEQLEFTSSGGRGEPLSRQVKSRFLTFYEGINLQRNKTPETMTFMLLYEI